jgi:hypothetical protein
VPLLNSILHHPLFHHPHHCFIVLALLLLQRQRTLVKNGDGTVRDSPNSWKKSVTVMDHIQVATWCA